MKTASNPDCSSYKKQLADEYKDKASRAWSVRERQKWERELERLMKS